MVVVEATIWEPLFLCKALFSPTSSHWLFGFHLCSSRNAIKCAVPSEKPSLPNWARSCFVDFLCTLTKALTIRLDTDWSYCQTSLLRVTCLNKGLWLFRFPEPVYCAQHAFVWRKWTSYGYTQVTVIGHLYLGICNRSEVPSTCHRAAFGEIHWV